MGLTAATALPTGPSGTPKWVDHPDSPALNKRMDDLLMKFQRGRPLFEREWYRSILFAAGHQWIIFDRVRGQWRRKKGPKWFPTPVTNRCSEHIDDNVSSLTRTPPDLSWLPADDNPKSIAAADVADRVDQIIAEETGRYRNARSKAQWSVVTGDVFIESGIDKSYEHGQVFIPYQECMDCGAIGSNQEFQSECPHCGSKNVDDARQRIGLECEGCHQQFPYDEALAHQPCPYCEDAATQAAPMGQEPGAVPPGAPAAPAPPPPMMKPVYGEEKIGRNEPKGKLWERVRSPFEVWYNLRTVRDFSKDGGLRECVIREMVDPDELRRSYPGIPIEEESASQVSGGSLSLQYLESASLLAGVLDPQNNQLASVPNPSGQGGRALKETLYQLPTEEYPNGLTVIRVNNRIIAEVKPLSYHENDGTPFIPVVHIPFKKQAGRVPGRTFMTDIIPLNKIRNETESMMMLCERRMGNPVNRIPIGTMEFPPTGEPGENWNYKYLSAGSGRPPMPDRIPGVEPNLYFERRIQALDQQMERLSGSFAVAHGEAPKGVTAASALALLGERQERAVSPQVQSWEQGHETIARQQMCIFREYATEERIKPIRDSLSRWSFENFSNADVDGNFTVKVESGSATPKSNAQMRATLEAEMKIPGLINIADPQVQRRVHQIMGTTTVIQQMDIDTRDAQKQQDLWLRQFTGEPGGQPMIFRELFDNHMVHAAEHIKFGKSDQYREIEMQARAGDPRSMALIAEYQMDLQQHLEAIAPPPMPEEGGGGPPGRPEGSGKVLSAGRKDVPATERAIVEPGAGAQDGLR